MSAVVVAVLALQVAAAGEGAIGEALRARDNFEHDRAVEVLRGAAEDAASEEAAAPYLWHLGAILAESRRVDEAKAAFKRAAATGVRPQLRVVVAPSIQALIDDAVASAPAPEPAPPPTDDSDRLADPPPDDAVPADAAPAVEAAPEGSSPSAPASDREGIGALGVGGLAVGAVGALAGLAGAVVWGFGLAEHFAATSSSSQVEAAARNEASAPLQLAGQVTFASGAAAAILGAVLFLVDGE